MSQHYEQSGIELDEGHLTYAGFEEFHASKLDGISFGGVFTTFRDDGDDSITSEY